MSSNLHGSHDGYAMRTANKAVAGGVILVWGFVILVVVMMIIGWVINLFN